MTRTLREGQPSTVACACAGRRAPINAQAAAAIA
jgi:hypothetical protein